VSNSDLIATVSRSVASEFEKYPNLRILPLPIPGPRIRIAVHWNARFAHDPALSWLRGIIEEIFEERAGRGKSR
jgi:DNA-binding transcriptional LysR family regulator